MKNLISDDDNLSDEESSKLNTSVKKDYKLDLEED